MAFSLLIRLFLFAFHCYFRLSFFSVSRWHQYGKPEPPQFKFALETALKPQLAILGNNDGNGNGSLEISKVYMVGDNPKSDMQGPNNMNAAAAEHTDREDSKKPCSIQWAGVLVRTGVYRDGVDDPNGADLICDDVESAVDEILARHGLLTS